MKYIIRILRVLAVILAYPIIFPISCIGMIIMPLIYLSISAFFYVKNGDNSESKQVDYYTDVVFHFSVEDIWEFPRKYILKLK